MLFAQKYRYMVPVEEERDCIIRLLSPGRCCVCGRPTEFVEINYEDYFCSEECVAWMDREAAKSTEEWV